MSQLFPAGRVAVLRLYGPIGGGAGPPTGSSSSGASASRSGYRPSSSTSTRRAVRRPPRMTCSWPSSGSPRKPLVAAIRGRRVGSYLAALAAQRILAQPHAVVGSIGVIRLGRTFRGSSSVWGDRQRDEPAGSRASARPGATRPTRNGQGAAISTRSTTRSSAGWPRAALTEERARELATGELWLGARRWPSAWSTRSATWNGPSSSPPGCRRPARSAPVRLHRSLVRLADRTVRDEPGECRRGRDRGPIGEPPQDVMVALA